MRIPFDISKRPQIESGEYKVETKDHHSVRIICWNKNTGGLDRIVALVAGNSGQEKTLHYTEEGCCVATGNNRDKDFFIVTPEPEMSEFENEMLRYLQDTANKKDDSEIVESTKEHSIKLLSIARNEFNKQIENDYREIIHGAYKRGKADAEQEVERRIQSGELMTQEHHEKLMETLREECKKDLPRWRKCEKPFDSPDNCGYNGKNLIHHGYALSIDNAYTKLPKDE